MGIQINGQTDTIRADDGSLILGDQVSASQVTVGLTTFHSTTAFVHNINSTGVVTATSGTFTGNLTGTTASFTGNVSVAGTLTYEDVTNVDSVGLITARNGVEITGGDLKVGTAVTISGGIVTATSYRGDGSQLTGIDASTLKDAGSVTRAQANTSGVQVTGILTATSLVGVLTTTTTNGNIDLTANGTGLIRVTENNLSQVPIVTQHDIGTNANEIPLNQYLGTAAFQDSSNFSVGNITVTGAMTLAGSSNASGITSSDLDDYEEGTWTPRLNGWNGSSYVNVSNTTNAVPGHYIKVGRQVTLFIRYQWSSMPVANGNPLYIYDLPFNVTNDHHSAGSMARIGGISDVEKLRIYKYTGSTNILYIQTAGAGTLSGMNGNNGELIATITYMASS